MFAVGDNVRVIRGYGKTLQVGALLVVSYCGSRHVKLVGISGGWYHDRFELVTDAPIARANDPATSKGKRKVNKYEQAVIKSLTFTKVGRTGKEIASDEEYPLNCITPRFAPLRRKGLIKDSGVKRDKQVVWVLA